MTWPAYIMWTLVLFGFVSSGPFLIYLQAISVAFGTLLMLPAGFTGGTNILPFSICSVFLVFKILLSHKIKSLLIALGDTRHLFFFSVFYVWCLISAFAMPRLFNGSVDIIPLGVEVPWPVPLRPTSSNITQSLYLTISFSSVVAGYFAMSKPLFVRHWIQGFVVTGLALIFTGVLDIVAGQSALLEAFRNANYTLLFSAEVNGSKRVVGLMTEASSYGSACVGTAGLLLLSRPCLVGAWRIYIAPMTIMGLLLMGVLSTSSAAYVGLVVLITFYPIVWIMRFCAPGNIQKTGLLSEAGILVLFCLVAIAFLVVREDYLNSIRAMLNDVLFDKGSSASAHERDFWTQTGLKAFYDTYGLGVGFGSARTSNWFVSELSNSGFVGCIFLGIFATKVVGTRIGNLNEFNGILVFALRASLLPTFILNALIGTTPDVPSAFLLGAILGLIFYQQKKGKFQPELIAKPLPIMLFEPRSSTPRALTSW